MKLKSKLLIAIGLAGTMFATHARAQTSRWEIDPAHSSVKFVVLNLSVSHVHGSFGNVKGALLLNESDITKSSVIATIDATTVSTGIAARDSHLKSADFFDTARNPAMEFKSTAVRKAGDKMQIVGDLTINGVSKSVTLDLDGPTPPQVDQGKTIGRFSASGRISRKDFNFGQKYVSPVLSDEVKFTVNVEIDKK